MELEGRAAESAAELAGAMQESAQRAAAVAAGRAELELARQDVERRQLEVDTLRADRSRFEGELEAARRDADQLRSSLEATRSEAEELRRSQVEADRLRTVLDATRDEVDAAAGLARGGGASPGRARDPSTRRGANCEPHTTRPCSCGRFSRRREHRRTTSAGLRRSASRRRGDVLAWLQTLLPGVAEGLTGRATDPEVVTAMLGALEQAAPARARECRNGCTPARGAGAARIDELEEALSELDDQRSEESFSFDAHAATLRVECQIALERADRRERELAELIAAHSRSTAELEERHGRSTE